MKLSQLMQHLTEDEKALLLKRVINGKLDTVSISAVSPYVSEHTQHKIIDYLLKNQSVEEVLELLPFLSESKLLEIYNSKDNLTDESRSQVAVFLTESVLKQIVNEYVKEKTIMLGTKVKETITKNNEDSFNTLKESLKELNKQIKQDFPNMTELKEPNNFVSPIDFGETK